MKPGGEMIPLIRSWLARNIGPSLSNRRFLFLSAALIALWAGLTGVVLKYVVHWLQVNVIALATLHPWVFLISPLVGIALTVAFIRIFLQGELERGTWHVLLAIARKSSKLEMKETYGQAVTSALTIGFGGSAGLESPIVQTGSAIGSRFALFFPVGYRDRTLMLACGAAAGIAAAFNAPIAGVLFALEVLLVDIHVSSFIPLLIAGAIGALCSRIVLHEDVLLSFSLMREFNWHNVPYYIILGILCGASAFMYTRALTSTQAWMARVVGSPLVRLVLGGLALGGLTFLFNPLFGEGYSTVKDLAALSPDHLFEQGYFSSFLTSNRWLLIAGVLLLGAIKSFAVALTLGSGGNGGNFAPSLFVGACLGFAFGGFLVEAGLDGVPVSNFCLVGMAGLLTGVFHSPLTAIFLIAEVTGGYGLMIPLMIVTALSAITSRFLNPRSLDETILHQRQTNVSFDRDAQLLSRLSTDDYIERDFTVIPASSTLRELVETVSRSKRNIFPVVDAMGQLAGLIALEDIRETMFNVAAYDTIRVDELMRRPLVTATRDEDMVSIMEKFDKSNVWNIPVLENGNYVGFISKSRIFSNYRERLKRTD